MSSDPGRALKDGSKNLGGENFMHGDKIMKLSCSNMKGKVSLP